MRWQNRNIRVVESDDGEVEGDDEGQDEAVHGDQQVPGQVDRLGRPVPTHETPATEMKVNWEIVLLLVIS